MRLYKYLLISNDLIGNTKGLGLTKPADYNYDDVGYSELVSVNNPIFYLQPSDYHPKLWFMGFKYPNFNDIDPDKDKYTAVVVMDEDDIRNTRELALNTYNSSWNANNDNKSSAYVKDDEGKKHIKYEKNENISDELIEFIIDEFDEDLEKSVGIYNNLNYGIRLKTGGNLGLYTEGKNIKLADEITGNNKEWINPYHIGHIFDYRKRFLVVFDTPEEEQEQLNYEKASGIIVRGRKMEYGIKGASKHIVQDIYNNTNTKTNTMGGVFVIDTPEMLEQLYNHLTDDSYYNTLTSQSVREKLIKSGIY